MAPPAPAVPPRSTAVVLSLASPAQSYAPSAPPTITVPRASSSSAGVALLVTAGAAGLLTQSLYPERVYGLMHSSRWQDQYLALERAFGSPAFGTPRSLDALVHLRPTTTLAEAPTVPVNAVNQAAPPKPSGAITPSEAAAPALEPGRTAATESADADPAPGAKGRAKSVAIASRHGRPAAKHAAADSEEAPPQKAAAPEPDEELPKKSNPFGLPAKTDAKKADAKKAPEPKDTGPTMGLDDAIKASMEKKGH